MLWPKKNSYKEFDNEKNSCGSKTPPLPPNNFSNGPSLNRFVLKGHSHFAFLMMKNMFTFAKGEVKLF